MMKTKKCNYIIRAPINSFLIEREVRKQQPRKGKTPKPIRCIHHSTKLLQLKILLSSMFAIGGNTNRATNH